MNPILTAVYPDRIFQIWPCLRKCGDCKGMHCAWVNRDGVTKCYGCDEKAQRERAVERLQLTA